MSRMYINGKSIVYVIRVCHSSGARVDAMNSYRQIFLDKDIAIMIVLFITILPNKQ